MTAHHPNQSKLPVIALLKCYPNMGVWDMKSRSSSQTLSKVEIKKLSSELSKLAVEHATAIRDTTFLGLNDGPQTQMHE
jgi:hypothetical protein